MKTRLKYSLRILYRYRLYAGFALLGCSIAIVSVWFIGDYVLKSYQYDAFHTKHPNIYRISMEVTAGGSTAHYASTGIPLGEYLLENYPGVQAYATLSARRPTIRISEKVFQESGFFQANAQILQVFTFTLLKGNPNTLLHQPNSLMLSASLAEKYFNSIDVLGKTLSLDDRLYTVSGVFQDWPAQTHLPIKALFPAAPPRAYEGQDWFNLDNYTYVLIPPSSSQKALQESLQHMKTQHVSP